MLSLQIGQYEASLIGKRNEVVLDAVSKSQVKTMTKAYECLGKIISVGGKRKFETLKSNVDSERVFIQDQIGKMQLLINDFRTHIDVLTNNYKFDFEHLKTLCHKNDTMKKTFNLDFKVLIKQIEDYFEY